MDNKMTKVQKIVAEAAEMIGSNKGLADYLEANERTVYRWLSGEVKPNADYVIKIYELINSVR